MYEVFISSSIFTGIILSLSIILCCLRCYRCLRNLIVVCTFSEFDPQKYNKNPTYASFLAFSPIMHSFAQTPICILPYPQIARISLLPATPHLFRATARTHARYCQQTDAPTSGTYTTQSSTPHTPQHEYKIYEILCIELLHYTPTTSPNTPLSL